MNPLARMLGLQRLLRDVEKLERRIRRRPPTEKQQVNLCEVLELKARVKAQLTQYSTTSSGFSC